jgi:hypothetical protein
MSNDAIKDFIKFQINRKITSLYKDFLFILEDIRNAKYNITDDQYLRYRKRILDFGNDTIRETAAYLDKTNVTLDMEAEKKDDQKADDKV